MTTIISPEYELLASAIASPRAAPCRFDQLIEAFSSGSNGFSKCWADIGDYISGMAYNWGANFNCQSPKAQITNIMMPDSQSKNWCLIPAAGIGARMAKHQPKQYLYLGGQTILERVIDVFSGIDEISGIVVGIAENDTWWPDLHLSRDGVWSSAGGPERANTVLNGLQSLLNVAEAAEEDWVLVHDAARPCVDTADIKLLINTCRRTNSGGVIGVELSDTIKRKGQSGRIGGTEAREMLWRAMTPQMFRIGALMRALESALSNQYIITDESMAMELLGEQPLMINGNPNNIKVTQPEDLNLAAMILNL